MEIKWLMVMMTEKGGKPYAALPPGEFKMYSKMFEKERERGRKK